ncbi:MAG: MerR family transcriptional regulator [Halioglobus sp.]
MGAIELQRRPLYGIGTVARLTGVKPDTLRIWERRYQLGASHKTPSGRRLFTQADLEHLQLVAALVAAGTRIGEIASSERRTLEMLLRTRSNGAGSRIPERKPRVVFVGDALCDWLEEHQGCLVNVDALLARCALANMDMQLLDGVGEVDSLVAEVAGVGEAAKTALAALAAKLNTANVLVLHRYSNGRRLEELEQQGYTTATFPPDPAFLAYHLTLSAAVREAEQGSDNLGQLVQGKPRLFSERELSEARKIPGALDCECPRHITDLVRALATFEDYSARCSADSWQEASVHACLYAYTGQARWLMEKALRLVTDAHADERAG